jgi:hypothetical protein
MAKTLASKKLLHLGLSFSLSLSLSLSLSHFEQNGQQKKNAAQTRN